MKAVIPAAGLGTRFLPITKAQPKEMLPVYDRPAIQYVVEEVVQSGIDDILIITGKNKRAIEDHFDRSLELEISLRNREKEEYLRKIERISSVDIHFIRQKEQKGLGDAIYCARKYVGGEPFAVLLGDTITVAERPCTRQMMDIFFEVEAPVIAVEEVPMEKVGSYGVISYREDEKGLFLIEDLVEKPEPGEAPSNYAIIGRYLLTPDVFDFIEKTRPGKGGEIQLTDALRLLNRSRQIYGFKFEGRRYDIGNMMDWLKSTVELALADDAVREELSAFLRDVV
ncbi:MAG: UTP--glucose-1-phosphate uridylyltransferase [Methanobacteriota archaeon]|nr:MAG: UTP--glucose-1-phosphate uridylyltransferase [Euryarchaeota archaeon]